MVGSKFADRFPNRETFCPEYHHFGVDAELMEYAESVNKFIWCEEAKVYHHHPACSDAPIDETHTILRQMAKDDHKLQSDRKAAGMLWGKNFDLYNKK